jgi:hypothetical protein
LDARPTSTRPRTPAQRAAARLRRAAGTAGRLADELGGLFRLPGEKDPAPPPRRIAGICAWAAGLGIVGLIAGLLAVIAMLAGAGSWYPPTILIIGIGGILCTIGALASVHRRRLPWVMLGAASAAMVSAFAVTMAA